MVVDISGWCLVVVDGGRWWWMVVDIFWLVVGAGLIIFSNPFKSTYEFLLLLFVKRIMNDKARNWKTNTMGMLPKMNAIDILHLVKCLQTH